MIAGFSIVGWGGEGLRRASKLGGVEAVKRDRRWVSVAWV